jgi:hypothetical protein
VQRVHLRVVEQSEGDCVKGATPELLNTLRKDSLEGVHQAMQGLYFELCEKVSKREHWEINTQRRSSARVHKRPFQGVHRANTWKVLKKSQGRQSTRSTKDIL